MKNLTLTDAELLAILNEDVPYGDLTTETAQIASIPARLVFRARQEMVLCAIEEAARLFILHGAEVKMDLYSGLKVCKDTVLMEVRGTARILHRVWKTAQVLVEWASGISTACAAIVSAASPVTVACTRKQVPGAKALSVKAIRAGGATLHRLGLSESLLLFPEHRLYLNQTPDKTVARFNQAEPEKKLVVEIGNVAQALVWAKAGAGVLQLEKFTPEAVAECRLALREAGLTTLIAAAGGICAKNAAAYAGAGADLLVTSAPYSAPPCDVQVTFYR